MADPVAMARKAILQSCPSWKREGACEACQLAAKNILKMEVHLACHERSALPGGAEEGKVPASPQASTHDE